VDEVKLGFSKVNFEIVKLSKGKVVKKKKPICILEMQYFKISQTCLGLKAFKEFWRYNYISP